MNMGVSFSGEGWGHAARIGALCKELEKRHTLFFWCPETVMPFFKTIHSHSHVSSIPLLRLVKKDHRVQRVRTALANIKPLFFSKKKIHALARELQNRKIDVVIADYEPFLAKAARKAGIPVILLNHQGVLRSAGYGLHALGARLANWFMMPQHDELIVSSFYEGDVGPILREEVKNAKVTRGEAVVVYLKESVRDQLLSVLKKFPHEKFEFFPNKTKDFIETLASCKAVVAPAGHQLTSECLALGKPLLAIPEYGQYEQILNAHMLEKSGRGTSCWLHEVEEKLPLFLSSTNKFPAEVKDKGVKFVLKDDTGNAVERIERFLKDLTKKSTYS